MLINSLKQHRKILLSGCIWSWSHN